MNRLKFAELISAVGALALGVGLGALFPRWFGPAAGVIVFVGLLLHAFGMWDKHRLESMGQPRHPLWVVVLYWTCWFLLAGVVAVMIFSNRT